MPVGVSPAPGMLARMVVWRLVTHHKDPERLLAWAKSEGRIAVGWNGLGDLRDYGSEEEIRRAVRETGNRNWPFSGRQLLGFRDEMNVSDLVILSAGGVRRAVMQVKGGYDHAGPLDGDDRAYSHQRRATLTDLNADEAWRAAGGLADGQNVRWTLVRCARQVTLADGRLVTTDA